MYHHRLYAMVPMIVMTTVTRKCATVLRTDRSNVIVTNLMMVVQGGEGMHVIIVGMQWIQRLC